MFWFLVLTSPIFFAGVLGTAGVLFVCGCRHFLKSNLVGVVGLGVVGGTLFSLIVHSLLYRFGGEFAQFLLVIASPCFLFLDVIVVTIGILMRRSLFKEDEQPQQPEH